MIPEPPRMDFATILTTLNSADAQLATSRLEAAGFHPFVANEATALWTGTAAAVGGILVQVPEAEAANAREFLNQQ
jgi:hypothetical protein